MADEAPSKTLLLERQAERQLVREGRSVLEDRRDLLAHLLVQQVTHTERLIADASAAFDRLRILFQRTVMRHGQSGLVRFAAAETGAPAVQWTLVNRMGTAWVETAIEPPAQPEPDVEESWIVSLELAAARQALTEALPLLSELAVAENNLARLTDVFRRTQRRVNALEHIVLPELNHDIKDMEDRLDEMERDDLIRSLLIKRRQTAEP